MERESKTNHAEERVSKFYNTVGWESESGVTEDARQWEDMGVLSRISKQMQKRLLRHIPRIWCQFPRYGVWADTVQQVYRVLEKLSETLLYRPVQLRRYRCGTKVRRARGLPPWQLFEIDLDEVFDCTVSLHTVYHMDQDEQEEAVKEASVRY